MYLLLCINKLPIIGQTKINSIVFFTVKQLPPVGFFFSLLNLDKNLKIQIHLINNLTWLINTKSFSLSQNRKKE